MSAAATGHRDPCRWSIASEVIRMTQRESNRIQADRTRVLASEWGSATAPVAELPPSTSFVHILGVDYAHMVLESGGDLYLTHAGMEVAAFLQPENWYELSWFRAQRERLEGTALLYAVPTRPVDGESLALVVRYSRVGEKVPITTNPLDDVLCCEFNGPFEEFGLLEELRAGRPGAGDLRVSLQTPLAIYVPPERMQASQTQRFQWRVARKVAQHPGVAIDLLREYLMIYRWLPGLDAWQAHQQGMLSEQEMTRCTERASVELQARGFRVLDMKPEHIIVEPTSQHDVARDGGHVSCGLIDFELLERTPEGWQDLQNRRKVAYRRRREALLQTDDEPVTRAATLPENLELETIFGVDFVHGRAESTGGMLWVVGRDAELFEYFVPERWRTTPQLRFGESKETFFTTSKDGLRLVWKVSRVGEPPRSAAFGARGFEVLAQGFNSPFEELALAWWLGRRGLPVTVPCAIYRTGSQSQLPESLFDRSRFRSHARFRAIDSSAILEPLRNYITVWDFWGGREDVAEDAAAVSRSVNLDQALTRGLVTDDAAERVLGDFAGRLERLGVEVLRLQARHILVALADDAVLATDEEGRLDACLCNFEFLRVPDHLLAE
jgi:hypothetical protein